MSDFKQEPLENTYEIGAELGSGQFAVVRRCRHISTGHEYAAKFIRKRRGAGGARGGVGGRGRGVRLDDIRREVDVLRSLNHSNIVALHDVFESKMEVILLLELVSGGELFEYLAEREKVSEDEAVVFLKQILDGLQHMHEKSIVHLDLKPENLMLQSKSCDRLIIIDFGLSRQLDGKSESRELLGTAEFVAPEVINYDPLLPATDMWAIGVITYILLSGCSPFLGDSQQETLANVTGVEYDFDNEHFGSTSTFARDFIQKLLVKHPKDRLTVTQCLAHPWIQPQEEKQKKKRRSSSIDIENLKSFVARRRWQQSYNAICVCNKVRRGRKDEEEGAATDDCASVDDDGGDMNSACSCAVRFLTDPWSPSTSPTICCSQSDPVCAANGRMDTPNNPAARKAESEGARGEGVGGWGEGNEGDLKVNTEGCCYNGTTPKFTKSPPRVVAVARAEVVVDIVDGSVRVVTEDAAADDDEVFEAAEMRREIREIHGESTEAESPRRNKPKQEKKQECLDEESTKEGAQGPEGHLIEDKIAPHEEQKKEMARKGEINDKSTPEETTHKTFSNVTNNRSIDETYEENENLLDEKCKEMLKHTSKCQFHIAKDYELTKNGHELEKVPSDLSID